MREIRPSGSEGGGAKPIASPYPYRRGRRDVFRGVNTSLIGWDGRGVTIAA